MAGYNDSEGPYTNGAPGLFTHLSHITDITNKFDKDATPATGEVLSWNGTVYVPVASSASFYTEVAVPTGVAATDKANIQAAIDAAITADRGVVQLQPGEYVVNTGLSVPPGGMVVLRGTGKGAVGGWVGTRIKRTSGTTPIIAATGTGTADAQRAILEIYDMELAGNDTAGTVLQIARASHLHLGNVRVCNNVGGKGVHLTEVWDSTIDELWVENCGSGTTHPAMLMDSVVSAGADANCATIQITNITFQSNYGTDWKLTGSAADGSACNDIEVVNVKMEGTGAGTSGTPDTYPWIDLDYAQNCQFTNVRISVPTGRASVFVQQTGTNAGSRANRFINEIFDIAGSNSPARFIDHSVGALVFSGMTWVGQPTSEYVRVQSSVAVGRFRIENLQHNSPAPWSGFITDTRTISEELNKGRINVPIMSGTGTLTTLGDNAVWSLADAADQYVRGQIILPPDVDYATSKAYLRAYWATSATGNVHWSWHQRAVSAGGNLSTAGTQVDSLQTSPGVNLLGVTSWSDSAGVTVTPGQLVTVRFGRKGTEADDTVTGVAYVVALELYYDKRI